MTDSFKRERARERALTLLPLASAVLHHQSMLQNLWNLWKWECGNAGDESNLSAVQFPSFQRSAAIRRTLWSQQKPGMARWGPMWDF